LPNLQELDALTDFGLTVTQAKVYLCLNTLGSSKAGKLAEHAQVPRQDIYRVLNELFEIGLVEKQVQMPTIFNAIPIHKCINLLVKQRDNKTKELQKNAIRNLRYKKKIENNKVNPNSTVIIQKKDPVLLRAEQLLTSVSKCVDVLSPPNRLYPWIFDHSILFENALKRHVQIKVLTSNNVEKSIPKVLKEFCETSLLDIRFLDKIPSVSFGIYDQKKIIFELEVNNGYLESQALVSDNPCLIKLASDCFKFEWSQAISKIT